MASPVIDGSAKAAFNGSSGSISVTTSDNTDSVVLIMAYNEGSGGTLPTSNTPTATGLTFTLRSRSTNTLSNPSGDTAGPVAVEIWTAPQSAAGAHTISVGTSASVDNGTLVAFGVNGLNSTLAPFDNNSGLTASATGQIGTSTGSAPAVVYSTSQSDDLLLYACLGASGTGSLAGGAPSGFTSLQTQANSFGADWTTLSVGYLSVSSTQSSQTATDPNTQKGNYIAIVDAFTADASTTTATVSLALTKASFSAADTGTRVSGFALTKASFSAANTGTRVSGFALTKASFAVAEAEKVSGAVSAFALGKALFSIAAGTFQGAGNVLGARALRVIRGIRDTIAGGSVVGRLPGAGGGAQEVPITMIADQVGRILAGSVTASPTTKSAGAAALQKQASAIATAAASAAVTSAIVPPCIVSALPAGFSGQRGLVTDSNQTLAAGIGTAVTTGGSYHVPVYYDAGASAWIIG